MKFTQQQTNLRENLSAWEDDGCGNRPGGPRISGDSWKWATRPAPSPDSISVSYKTVGLAVGIGVGVGAAIYFTGGLALLPAAAL